MYNTPWNNYHSWIRFSLSGMKAYTYLYEDRSIITSDYFMRCRPRNSPSSGLFRANWLQGNATIFWDSQAMILTYDLQKGRTTTRQYYSDLLCRLDAVSKEKGPRMIFVQYITHAYATPSFCVAHSYSE